MVLGITEEIKKKQKSDKTKVEESLIDHVIYEAYHIDVLQIIHRSRLCAQLYAPSAYYFEKEECPDNIEDKVAYYISFTNCTNYYLKSSASFQSLEYALEL